MDWPSHQNCKSPSEASFSQEWSLYIIHITMYALVSWRLHQPPCFHSPSPSCTPYPFLASLRSYFTVSSAHSIPFTFWESIILQDLAAVMPIGLPFHDHDIFESIRFLFERGRTAAIPIPSGNTVKRAHLIITEAVVCSFHNKLFFGISACVLWGGACTISTCRSVFSLSKSMEYIFFFKKKWKVSLWTRFTIKNESSHKNLDFQVLKTKTSEYLVAMDSKGNTKRLSVDHLLCTMSMLSSLPLSTPVCHSFILFAWFLNVFELVASFCSSWQVYRPIEFGSCRAFLQQGFPNTATHQNQLISFHKSLFPGCTQCHLRMNF